jgi:hypothetical protein
MTKIEFLSTSLPYDLLLLGNNGDEEYTAVLGGIQCDIQYERYYDESGNEFEDFKPIVRPLDSLTKECIQSDYNDGKPFFPIKELEGLFPYCNFYLLDDNGKTVIGFDNRDYDNDVTIEEMMLIIQQLIKWHFWLNMPENEEVVYVSDEFNPYK